MTPLDESSDSALSVIMSFTNPPIPLELLKRNRYSIETSKVGHYDRPSALFAVKMDNPNQSLILLVDDFSDNLDLYREYLDYRGYRVVTAATGADAIAIAHAERPALILMDISMRGMTGTEAMQLLRANAAFADVPIVAFTAHALKNEHQQAMLDGFDGVISKPCLPDELAIKIDALLGRI